MYANGCLQRITPAYAGKSETKGTNTVTNKDHPRLCGEKVEKKGIRESRAGSPPPMRGKDNRTHDTERSIRITPAYAGKRHRRRTNVQQDQDHPRLCGEKEQRAARISETLGSPPPMRGKGASWKCLIDCKGITPAYAGKSLFTFRKVMRLRDHPRLCGEKYSVYFLPLYGIGSPPPMRGKVLLLHILSGHLGITPAYAGKRLSKSV